MTNPFDPHDVIKNMGWRPPTMCLSGHYHLFTAGRSYTIRHPEGQTSIIMESEADIWHVRFCAYCGDALQEFDDKEKDDANP